MVLPRRPIQWKLILLVATHALNQFSVVAFTTPAITCCEQTPFWLTNSAKTKRNSFRAKKTPTEQAEDITELKTMLKRYNFDARLRVISAKDLPILAEVYVNGETELCQVMALRPTKDPTIEVQPFSQQDSMVVDIGQVTTLWDNNLSFEGYDNLCQKVADEVNKFPVGSTEVAMNSLYKSHVGRARSSDKNPLTKKQITSLVADIQSEPVRAHAENVMRKLVKAGKGCSRLIDSCTAREFLYNSGNHKKRGAGNLVVQQAVAARVLSQDASTGGRFKRMPCTFIDKTTLASGNDDGAKSISVINGGWLVVDQAVRAGQEARKFANRIETSKNKGEQQIWTVSDERIAQRIECLAMGEVLSEGENSGLELDVREALKALGAPVTPEGGRDVLVKVGRWTTEQSTGQKIQAQPWSPDVLEAARWYSERTERKRMDWAASSNHNVSLLEGRTDLTNLPFICVDAKHTSFRDDAISLRPRAKTGRKISDASKWEILISTVDVSDIYNDNESQDKTSSRHLRSLRQAAASRGVSRYDLPRGPLHLLPPVVLQALSFDTIRADKDKLKASDGFNRCVTLWVYIDEKTGKLLDAGIERTVISKPTAFSYEAATDLLNGKVDTSGEPMLKRCREVLGVVERNLQLWSQQHRKKSSAAQKREERLALKEFVADQQVQVGKVRRRDDGSGGFQRSRGHQLVDTALDLYSYAISGLLRRANATLPYQAGTGVDRGTRVATAPLRRYVDGMAQRQALSVLCGYGGPSLSKEECRKIGQEATDAYNSISNFRSVKKGGPILNGKGNRSSSQKVALRNLALHLKAGRNWIVPAVSTGKENEVVITGVGAIAKCKGVKGTLEPGKTIMVKVNKIDVESGALSITLAADAKLQ